MGSCHFPATTLTLVSKAPAPRCHPSGPSEASPAEHGPLCAPVLTTPLPFSAPGGRAESPGSQALQPRDFLQECSESSSVGGEFSQFSFGQEHLPSFHLDSSRCFLQGPFSGSRFFCSGRGGCWAPPAGAPWRPAWCAAAVALLCPCAQHGPSSGCSRNRPPRFRSRVRARLRAGFCKRTPVGVGWTSCFCFFYAFFRIWTVSRQYRRQDFLQPTLSPPGFRRHERRDRGGPTGPRDSLRLSHLSVCCSGRVISRGPSRGPVASFSVILLVSLSGGLPLHVHFFTT